MTWSTSGQKVLVMKVMGLVKPMDAMLGPDFERGLSRLSVAAERPPA